MATNFPSSLDNFTNPVSGNTLDSPSHSLQHSDANDAIEAIEAKLGVGNSPAGSATAGQVLTISAAGTSAWTTPDAGGLVFINNTSFSGVSSVSLPQDSFTTTYDSYLVILKCSVSQAAYMQGRLRASGSDNTTSNYQSGWMGINTNGGAGSNDTQGAAGTTWTRIGYANGAGEIWIAYTFHAPKLANRTFVTFQQSRIDGIVLAGGAIFNTTTAFDSVSFIPSAGTISGSVSCFGYKQ